MVNFNLIEKKWQSKWEKKKIFKSKESKKKKFYCLEMFPYPSAYGLHMGHVKNYALGDVVARFKRMQGFNVLYPMGYDAFGLPAENAAIKENTHPKVFTEKAIKSIIKNQKALGLSYDWDRLIITCYPDYYKWNQWFFLKFLEKGLVYRKKAAANWCNSCKTVLANEEVEQGKCWRCNSDVEIKQLEQWFLRTTKYAEELLQDLKKLKGWPEKIKIMQENWIGKSYGTLINFKLKDSNKIIPIFTTRVDTLFGVTFMVYAPEHPDVLELVKNTSYEEKVKKFINKVVIEDKFSRTAEDKEKEGMFIGKYAINPVTNEEIPIYIANFVLPDYGTGTVMAVPAHDQRDFEFAKKYNISIKTVIKPEVEENFIVVHGCPSNIEKAMDPKTRTYDKHWIPWIKKELSSQGIKIETPLMPNPWEPDYNSFKKEFEKHKITENTILIGHSCGCAFLVRWLGETKQKINQLILVAPWKIPDKNDKFRKAFYEYPIDKTIKSRVKEIIMFTADDEEEDGKKSLKIFHEALGGKIIELKGRGHYILDDMGTEEFPELLNECLSLNKAYLEDGIMTNSNQFNGMNNRKAIPEINKFLEKNKIGKETVQYKLRDWLISRQRYWGTPIPIIYCEKCGIVPVPENKLPILLPEKVKFSAKENVLEKTKSFIDIKCPKCKGKARRETDTMGTFFDSSWYFLRYCSPKFKKLPFDKTKVKYWMPVDQYIGGAEHAVGHLMYARFFCKALRDLKILNFDEPFINLFNQGMLHKDGVVMSKSKGNIVSQEEISKKYGIDTARLFLLFVAGPDKDIEWSDKGIEGAYRFINKLYRLVKEKKLTKTEDKNLTSKKNKLIKEVTQDFDEFKFNLAIIKLMEFSSYLYKRDQVSRDSLETLIKLLAPFIPHTCEELWHNMGNKNFVSLEKWPTYEEKKIDKKTDASDEFLNLVRSDINSILNLVKIKPKLIKLFIAEQWKYDLFKKLRIETEKTKNIGEIIKKVIDKEHAKEISKIVTLVIKDPNKLPIVILNQNDELDSLAENLEKLMKEFNLKIEVFEERYAKEEKAKQSLPGKPAILLE